MRMATHLRREVAQSMIKSCAGMMSMQHTCTGGLVHTRTRITIACTYKQTETRRQPGTQPQSCVLVAADPHTYQGGRGPRASLQLTAIKHTGACACPALADSRETCARGTRCLRTPGAIVHKRGCGSHKREFLSGRVNLLCPTHSAAVAAASCTRTLRRGVRGLRR